MSQVILKLEGLSADEFRKEFDQLWSELRKRAQTDTVFAEELRKLGVSPEEFANQSRTSYVQIDQKSSGLGLEEVVLQFLIGLALLLVEKYVLPDMKRGKDREAIQHVVPTESDKPGSQTHGA